MGGNDGKPFSEDDEPREKNPRVTGESDILSLTQKGVRVIIIRLPPSVHGKGDYQFIPMMIKNAREKKAAGYLEGEVGLWSGVNVDDAADLYVLALTKGKSGSKFHAVNDHTPLKKVAELIGEKLNVPVVEVKNEKAGEHFGGLAYFQSFRQDIKTDITRRETGWNPKGKNLLEEMTEYYF